ncbi:MAG: sensor histidine kinase [Mangrovibacterium sp.]
MELYLKKRRWKILLFLIAILIGTASLYYTNWLVNKVSVEERKSVALWAEATNRLAQPDNGSNNDMDFLLRIIESNTDIPIILTDSLRNIIDYSNINFHETRREQVLERKLRKMIREHEPIKIVVSNTETQYLYYRDSKILQNLKYFPLAQFGVISLFIMVSYLAFSSSRKAEQNQVWVGMSKETAHQLGTPISSLMAWIELLKMQGVKPDLIREFEKDITRLEKITERFSKIGSAPELISTDLKPVVLSTVSYLEGRTSKRVKFITEIDMTIPFTAPHNPALFSWVIENLCKNAVDAIENEGTITLRLSENSHTIALDISDTGKGIPKSNHKTIFEPGYTTKKRGWGLGLSLAKRIIENYHQGKIFIKQSEPGKGTTFRITLPKT